MSPSGCSARAELLDPSLNTEVFVCDVEGVMEVLPASQSVCEPPNAAGGRAWPSRAPGCWARLALWGRGVLCARGSVASTPARPLQGSWKDSPPATPGI